jgi:hypothetical protein
MDGHAKCSERGAVMLAFPLDRLDATWAAWHHAKAFLAILGDYFRQGKPLFEALGREARKRWVNRKHDLDYLVSLTLLAIGLP